MRLFVFVCMQRDDSNNDNDDIDGDGDGNGNDNDNDDYHENQYCSIAHKLYAHDIDRLNEMDR